MPVTKVGGFIGQLPITHGGGFPFGYLAAIPVIAAVSSHGGGSTTGTGASTTGTGASTTGTDTLGTTGTGSNGNTTGTTGETTGTMGSTGTTTGTATGTTGTATGTDTLGTNTGNTGVSPVPEPGAPAAFAVGGAALLYLLGSAKWRRSKAS